MHKNEFENVLYEMATILFRGELNKALNKALFWPLHLACSLVASWSPSKHYSKSRIGSSSGFNWLLDV